MAEVVTTVNEADFEQEVLRSAQTVLVDFYADWCGPCRLTAPIIEQIAQENKDPNFKIVKVDIDAAKQLAADLVIKSIPTFKIFKNGEEVASIVGAHTKKGFLTFIEENK
ncbi:thioredoxin [Patescibacteria group bacterium]